MPNDGKPILTPDAVAEIRAAADEVAARVWPDGRDSRTIALCDTVDALREALDELAEAIRAEDDPSEWVSVKLPRTLGALMYAERLLEES